MVVVVVVGEGGGGRDYLLVRAEEIAKDSTSCSGGPSTSGPVKCFIPSAADL